MAGSNVRTTERWKAVPGYEGLYEVSDHGRVCAAARTVRHTYGGPKKLKRRVLKPYAHRGGYLSVTLCKDGQRTTRLVHQLVALAFLGEAPGQTGVRRTDWQINHKNFDTSDNRPENLEWTTGRQNYRHALKNGRMLRGEEQAASKLTEENVREIRGLLADGEETHIRIAARYGVDKGLISQIKRGIVWTHVK